MSEWGILSNLLGSDDAVLDFLTKTGTSKNQIESMIGFAYKVGDISDDSYNKLISGISCVC